MSSDGETTKDSSATVEVRWTDASIRWPDSDNATQNIATATINNNNDSGDDDDDETPYMDPFQDPDPVQEFLFRFDLRDSNDDSHDQTSKDEDGRYIDISLRGRKMDSDEVFESTGLTIWKAAEYLCQYQIENSTLFQGKRVLEVRSICHSVLIG